MQVHDVTVTEFVYFVYLMNFIGGIIYDLFLSNIFIVFFKLEAACMHNLNNEHIARRFLM